MAGKMRLDLRPIGLDQVIERALESLKPEFDKKPVHVHTHLDPTTPPVLGDLGRLQQIAWNLLSNALKFTPAGGEVFVELRHEANLAQIVVRDTGDGIDPAFLPFVFERFRQGDASTRRPHGGLGIGLALVKSLAELHGGAVSAASEGPGRGATFTLALPADPSLELTGSDIRATANSGGRS